MTDAVGRLDYISNPDRQERLLAVGGNVDPQFWVQLAADAQEAWRTNGGSKTKTITVKGKDGQRRTKVVKRRAYEAREIHVALPEDVKHLTAQERKKVAEDLAEHFRSKYGVECVVGLHESMTDGNVHAHVLFSDRLRLPEPEIKVADRNVFLDEQGVRKRTKKEILGADGQLRSGCRIVPKGAVLSTRYFRDHDEIFGQRDWLHAAKKDLANWINERLQPDMERTVFDPAGPYLAQIHVGKGRPAEQADHVRTYNEEVKVFNAAVRDGRIPEETAHQIKTQVLLSPDRLQALRAAAHMVFDNTVQMTEELQGGVRTAEGPDEQKKRELRELYRKAAAARQAAAQTAGLERNTFQAEARRYSARIDRLRMELGYYKDEDYERKLRKIREEELRKQEWLMKCRSRVARLEYRVDRLQSRVKYLERQLYTMPWLLLDEKEKAQKARLEAELKEARGELEAARLQEAYARMQYRQEKKLAKDKRKELKQDRRQIQKHRSQQHDR